MESDGNTNNNNNNNNNNIGSIHNNNKMGKTRGKKSWTEVEVEAKIQTLSSQHQGSYFYIHFQLKLVDRGQEMYVGMREGEGGGRGEGRGENNARNEGGSE